MSEKDLEPAGTYRPQFRLRWRGLARALDRFPRVKAGVADLLRGLLGKVFDPGIVTTERVVEYPFVYQSLPKAPGTILDIGSVHTRLPIVLASRGYRVVSLDYLPYPYRHPNLCAVRGDAMRCPFAAQSFDAILAISVIEHVGIGHYGDPSRDIGDREAVREIARLLKPGGLVLLTVPFGRALTDASKRVYDSARLSSLLAPLPLVRPEYAWSREGLWTPCTESEAATADWSGATRAVALIAVTMPRD